MKKKNKISKNVIFIALGSLILISLFFIFKYHNFEISGTCSIHNYGVTCIIDNSNLPLPLLNLDRSLSCSYPQNSATTESIIPCLDEFLLEGHCKDSVLTNNIPYYPEVYTFIAECNVFE